MFECWLTVYSLFGFAPNHILSEPVSFVKYWNIWQGMWLNGRTLANYVQVPAFSTQHWTPPQKIRDKLGIIAYSAELLEWFYVKVHFAEYGWTLNSIINGCTSYFFFGLPACIWMEHSTSMYKKLHLLWYYALPTN